MLCSMGTLLIAIAAGLGFIVAYHTYGRWLGHRIFALSAQAVCPSQRLNDGTDYVPTKKAIIFGHHFTSIAGTGPIVGPAIAVMWGWLPALIWVVLGSVFIGAVHDLGAMVVSMRHNGQTIGDVAGRVLNRRVRILFLLILFMGLTIVLAIFGLVIATVFRQYPASIFPCTVQIPIAVAIGVWLHRKGASLLVPSIIALAIMYLTVVIGDDNFTTTLPILTPLMHGLHAANAWMASWSNMTWVIALLLYSYVASVLPVWLLLQPRDYINSLQLLSAMGLIVIGLIVAAFIGGAPPVEGAARQPLEVVAPMWNPHPAGAPMIFPFLFITIACGAVSGFHCLVSSGTSSKQIESEPDARFVGYGSMLTEGFLATLVIIACVAGLGLGFAIARPQTPVLELSGGAAFEIPFVAADGAQKSLWVMESKKTGNTTVEVQESWDGLPREPSVTRDGVVAKSVDPEGNPFSASLVGRAAFNTRYQSWQNAGGLARTVAAFVDGSANLLRAIGLPLGVAVALMGVLVASFAGTTLDTACRLQRYVVQELAATFLPTSRDPRFCPKCGYTLWQRMTSHSRRTAPPTPEGSRNVATGAANPEGMDAARGNDARNPSSPEGATESSERAAKRTTPSPLRGSNQSAPDSHGFRDAQSSLAPPAATPHRPSGTEDNAPSSRADIQCPECGECITPEEIERTGESITPGALNFLTPIHWLTNKHGATIFAIVIATVLAALPAGATDAGGKGFWGNLLSAHPQTAWDWIAQYGGKGGLILWPLFGATNQLLAGLSFIVITLYLWRRRKPLWFLIVPMIFMLIMPLWAMGWQVFIGSADSPRWLMPIGGDTQWPLALIGIASIIIEIWMIVEAMLVLPRVRGIVEQGATDVPREARVATA